MLSFEDTKNMSEVDPPIYVQICSSELILQLFLSFEFQY